MASQNRAKSFKSVKAVILAARRHKPGEEAGQPCPRCGDLWPWSHTRCETCGALLA